MRWYLIVALVCIPLIIRDVEHLFVCLLAVCMSSLEEWLVRPSTDFVIRFLFFCCCCLLLYIEIYELFVYFGN